LRVLPGVLRGAFRKADFDRAVLERVADRLEGVLVVEGTAAERELDPRLIVAVTPDVREFVQAFQAGLVL